MRVISTCSLNWTAAHKLGSFDPIASLAP